MPTPGGFTGSTDWQDFWDSLKPGGMDLFYGPKYYAWTESSSLIKPWWYWIPNILSKLRDAKDLIKIAWSTPWGWLLLDENAGYGDWDIAKTLREKILYKFWGRLGYLLKVTLCILLGLTKEPRQHFYDYVEIAAWDFHSLTGEYSGQGWQCLEVGRGWRNWVYHSFYDASV